MSEQIEQPAEPPAEPQTGTSAHTTERPPNGKRSSDASGDSVGGNYTSAETLAPTPTHTRELLPLSLIERLSSEHPVAAGRVGSAFVLLGIALFGVAAVWSLNY